MHFVTKIISFGAVLHIFACENIRTQRNVVGNFISHSWNDFFYLDPEVFMNTSEIIAYHGFEEETHIVTTADGFILEIQRISSGRLRQRDPDKQPVVIVHGTGADAFSWVMNLPNETFAFILADEGYDVWLPNLRGTVPSQRHTSLNPTQKEFWEFTLDEMATYDLPVIIDHILKETGHSQLIYSGHSLGGGIMFMLLATQPEYKDKVKSIFAMAPIGNFANAGPLLKLGGFAEPFIKIVTSALGIYSTASSSFPSQKLTGLFAKYFGKVYIQFYFMALFGKPDRHADSSRVPIYATHINGTTSLYVLFHEAQIINSNKLQHYDWGKQKNLLKYGLEVPPEYDISKVDVPSYLYYGDIDNICSKKNVQFLKDHLANAVTMKEFGKDWNHFDYFLGRDAGSLVYNEFKEMIKNDN